MAKSNIANKFRMLGSNQKRELERDGYYTNRFGTKIYPNKEEYQAFLETRKEKKGGSMPTKQTGNKNLDSQSSPEEKKYASEAVFELLADFLFEKITLITYAFSEVTSGGYTGTSDYRGWSRLPNTSRGKFLTTGKRSRSRLNFYLKNHKKIDAYVLTPVAYDSDTSLNDISSMDVFRAYVGLKIDASVVSVAIKEASKQEILYPTNVKITGEEFSTTYKLEVVLGAKTATIFLDGEKLGDYPADYVGNFNVEPYSFLPFITPARSKDGTSINVTLENFQFIQDN